MAKLKRIKYVSNYEQPLKKVIGQIAQLAFRVCKIGLCLNLLGCAELTLRPWSSTAYRSNSRAAHISSSRLPKYLFLFCDIISAYHFEPLRETPRYGDPSSSSRLVTPTSVRFGVGLRTISSRSATDASSRSMLRTRRFSILILPLRRLTVLAGKSSSVVVVLHLHSPP